MLDIPKKEINDIISYNLKTQIELTLENKPKFNINCEINITLIPIKILLFNEQFNFKYTQSKTFLFCLSEIFEDEDIILNLKNYYQIKNKDLNPELQLITYDDNTANKPKIVFKNQQIIIKGQFSSFKLHFLLNVYISQNFVIPIEINCNIIPFDYSFEVFDFNIQHFTNNKIKIKVNNEFKGKIYFRIILPKNKRKYDLSLSPNIEKKESMTFYLKEKSKTLLNNIYCFNVEVNILNLKNSFTYTLTSIIFGKKKI